MRAIMAAKFKLRKKAQLSQTQRNTNAQFAIVAMSQTTVGIVFTMGDILATVFSLNFL